LVKHFLLGNPNSSSLFIILYLFVTVTVNNIKPPIFNRNTRADSLFIAVKLENILYGCKECKLASVLRTRRPIIFSEINEYWIFVTVLKMSGLRSTEVRPVEAALIRADEQTGQMEGGCDGADWRLSLVERRAPKIDILTGERTGG
jgi:hypothetical protein